MNNPMVIDKYNIYDIFYVNDRVHIITPTSNDESHKMKITYKDIRPSIRYFLFLMASASEI